MMWEAQFSEHDSQYSFFFKDNLIGGETNKKTFIRLNGFVTLLLCFHTYHSYKVMRNDQKNLLI